MTLESLPSAAEAELITEALRRSGVVSSGRVSGVAAVGSLKKLRSQTFRLRLEYEQLSAGAPYSIILKIGHLNASGHSAYANRREIAFYRDVTSAASAPLVPRCFEAVEATDVAPWHLLLEDLTESHFIATEWPLPPTFTQCEIMAQALARFHGAWWDSRHLGASVGIWCTPDSFDQDLRTFAGQFALFLDRFGELVPLERRALYEQLLDQAPRLLARYHSHRLLTVIHGDAHAWNFFLPLHGGPENVRMIDWEDWGIQCATDDLAYMMANALVPGSPAPN